MATETLSAPPECIASTGTDYCQSVGACNPHRKFKTAYGVVGPRNESNSFRSAQLSADGSTVVTYSEDLTFRTFVLPPNLLDSAVQPHALKPYSASSTVASKTFALYPYYNLSNIATTIAIHSANDLPIRLSNVLDFTNTIHTYPWINATTERFESPWSLAFTRCGSRFIAGGDHRIAVFDIDRTDAPIVDMSTKQSRDARRFYGDDGSSLGGFITALAIDQSSRTLAAGSSMRKVSLFEDEGSGAEIATFEVSNKNDLEEREWEIDGDGINQMMWTGDARYLIVGERQSNGLLVYDIRVTGKRLAWLKGRNAGTTLKCAYDMVDMPGRSPDIWAGGTDGVVRVWKGVTDKQGVVEHDDEFKASSDSVSSVMLHHTAPIFATTSGQRYPYEKFLDLDSDSESDSESDDEMPANVEEMSIDDRSDSNTSVITRPQSSSSTSSSASSSAADKLDNTLKIWYMTGGLPSAHAPPP